MIGRLRHWASELKAQLLTLWHCRSHPDTPLAAKLLAALVVGYALSPIDLIPDFIPVLGYLDDLILVPLGIALVVRLIPEHVLTASREKANQWLARNEARSRNYIAAAIILITWAALAYWAWIAFAGLPAVRAPIF